MQDRAVFCLTCEVLTYGPINVVIRKAKDNIYLEKSIVGNRWPHRQLRQVRLSALLSAELPHFSPAEDPAQPVR